MKVTLDLDRLLSNGQICLEEYEKLSAIAAENTNTLAINIIVAFGVAAIVLAMLFLVKSTHVAIAIGCGLFFAGIKLRQLGSEKWRLSASAAVLIGALMAGGGITEIGGQTTSSILIATLVFAAAAVIAGSVLLAIVATLSLASVLGATTSYHKASYMVAILEPTATIVLFSILALVGYWISQRVSEKQERVALASARTSLFLVNVAFWVGSFWGERSKEGEVIIANYVFSLVWAAALICAAVWAWKRNLRWTINLAVVFGAIHFYTQWFEALGASPISVLCAGLLALAIAIWLKGLNESMQSEG